MEAPAPGDKSPIGLASLCFERESLCRFVECEGAEVDRRRALGGGAQQRTLDSSTAVEFYFHLNHETLMNFIYFPPPSVNVRR